MYDRMKQEEAMCVVEQVAVGGAVGNVTLELVKKVQRRVPEISRA
jgi:hypothetical protein